MPITQERMTKLRNFGLSEYAARAYISLLDLGIAEARDISSLSKVPQAKIYHVLEQLHEKGLVVILPEFPKKYAPVPFEDFLARVHDEHTKAAAAIESEREELAEMFRVMGDTDVGNRGFFTVIRGRRNILDKIEEMMGATKDDMLILDTAGSAGRVGGIAPEMARARERGVRIRVLAPLDATTIPKLAVIRDTVDLRARELGEEEQSSKVAIVVSDGARAFLIHYVPDDANLYAGKDIGVFTDQEAMVAAIQAIVEPHWSRAVPFEARRAEIEDGRAPEFTRVLGDLDGAWSALRRSVEGAREVAILDANAAGATPPDALAVARIARAQGARARVVVSAADPTRLDALVKEAEGLGLTEVRHLAPSVVFRHWIVDDREAFFSVARHTPGETSAGDLVIHTNAPAVVRSLRAHFDALWAGASALSTRRRELALFPHLQPDDLGLGLLFELLGDGVVVARPDGTIVLWNSAAARLLDLKAEDALRTRLTDLVDPPYREGVERALSATLEAAPASADGRRRVEAMRERPGAGPLHVEWTLSALVSPGSAGRLVLAIARDATERKRAQEDAMRAQMRIVRTYEAMTEAFFALDKDYRIVYTNPVTERMNTSGRSYVGRILWEGFPDLKGTKFWSEFRRAMEERVPVSFEDVYPRMERWFEVNAYPYDDGLMVFFRDVTSRKERESALRRSEARFLAAFEAVHTPLAVADPEGRIVQANARFAEMTRDGAPGSDIAGLVEEADRPRLRAAFAEAAAGKVAEAEVRLVVGPRVRLELRALPGSDGDSSLLVQATQVPEGPGRKHK